MLGVLKGASQSWWESSLSLHPLSPLDTMDFSGLSLIKLKKQEMETQVSSFMPQLPGPLLGQC